MSEADPTYGVDISGWQKGIDLKRVKSEGYDFCIVKATEGPYPDGTSFTNPAYAEQMRDAKAAGLIAGVYHFLVETPAKAQVDHFLKVAGDVAGKIVVVDYEAYPTAGFSHLDPTMKTLEDFVGELRRRIGDHPIVVYAGQGYWNSPPPNGPITHLDVTTWDAWYQHMKPGGGPALYKEARVAGMGWGKRWGDQEPMLWQFSQAGKVAGMQIDVDAFRGTREQLLALAGGGDPPQAADETKPADTPTAGNGAPKKAKVFWDAIDYLRPAIGQKRTPYWVWEDGIVPDGPGAFAINRPVPSIEYVKGEPGIFCAGVTNLILRHAGKRVPTRGSLAFDGGLAAYFHGMYGDGYYTGFDEPFDMAKAKKWADEMNCGVMIGKGYYGTGLDSQGHVAVLLPKHTDGKYYVLQSYGGYPKWPGLNWDATIEQSNAGGYYKRMVHPENWLLYEGDEY